MPAADPSKRKRSATLRMTSTVYSCRVPIYSDASLVPIALERLIATLSDQYGHMRKDRAHVTIMVALRESQRLGRNRYQEKGVFLRDFGDNRRTR